MFLSDLLIAKKYLFSQLALMVVVGVFMSVVMQNLYVIPPAIAVMVPFSIGFTLLALDERAGWEQFRLALPLSRANVIVGRYASFAAVVLMGMATGLLVTGLVALAAALLPGVPQLADMMVNFSWQAIVLSSVAGVTIVLAMLAVTLPVVSRFGMTKAVRFIPLAMVFGMVFLFSLGNGQPMPQFLVDLAAWIKTPEGTLGAAGIVAAAGCTLYALSCAASVKLYEGREL